MKEYSLSQRKGCPTCEGVDPKSCLRCKGKTLMLEWFLTDTGHAHVTQMSLDEFKEANRLHNKSFNNRQAQRAAPAS